MTLSEVANFVRFINQVGHPWDQENLAWSKAFLQESCEPDLQAKIAEQLYTLQPEEIGGPTFFWIMMTVITSLSEEAVRSMTEEIRTMKISERGNGENITQIVSLLRGAIGRLRNLNKVPQDMLSQLVRLFQTTSVPKFNRLFENAESNIKMKVGNATIDSLLQLAEDSYNEAVACKEWHSPGKGSSFIAGKNNKKKAPGDNSPLTCWNCGKQGHRANACPDPPKNQRGGNNQPARAAGRRLENDADWKTVPPEAGESHTKEVDGKTWFWCGKCFGGGRWNLTHKTAAHKVGVGRKARQGQAQGQASPQANVASPPTEPSSSANGSGPRVSFGESVQGAVNHFRS